MAQIGDAGLHRIQVSKPLFVRDIPPAQPGILRQQKFSGRSNSFFASGFLPFFS
jgi:hypothetical protein